MTISTSSGKIYEDSFDHLMDKPLISKEADTSVSRKSDMPVLWAISDEEHAKSRMDSMTSPVIQNTTKKGISVPEKGIQDPSVDTFEQRFWGDKFHLDPGELPTVNVPGTRVYPYGHSRVENKDMLIVRHGMTDYNKPGGEVGKEYIRGHLDVPLNAEGHQQAADMAQKLKDNEEIKPGELIVTSDLSRARDTAQAIKEATGAKMLIDPDLRPWNLGDFQGKEVAVCKDQLEGYCFDTPDKPVPNGESFNQFKDRASDALIRAAQMGAAAVVTHHRVDRLDESMKPDGSIDYDKFLSKGEDTGTYRPAKLAMADEEMMKGKVVSIKDFPAPAPPSGGAVTGPAQILRYPTKSVTNPPPKDKGPRSTLYDDIIDKGIQETATKGVKSAPKTDEEKYQDALLKQQKLHPDQINEEWLRRGGQRTPSGEEPMLITKHFMNEVARIGEDLDRSLKNIDVQAKRNLFRVIEGGGKPQITGLPEWVTKPSELWSPAEKAAFYGTVGAAIGGSAIVGTMQLMGVLDKKEEK